MLQVHFCLVSYGSAEGKGGAAEVGGIAVWGGGAEGLLPETAVAVPVMATVAVSVGVGKAGNQICWPIFSRLESRQLTAMSRSTVMPAAWLSAESESLA